VFIRFLQDQFGRGTIVRVAACARAVAVTPSVGGAAGISQEEERRGVLRVAAITLSVWA